MKNSWLVNIITLCFLVSCSVDYDFGGTGLPEKDRLVVNCLLSPQKNVNACFYVTQRVDSGYTFRPIKDTYVTLKENGSVLFDGICADTILTLEVCPTAGAVYSLQAKLDGYETITAETSIPLPMNCKAVENGDSNRSGKMMKISEFTGHDGQSALWIIVTKNRESGKQIYCNNYQTICPYIDRVNREESMGDLVSPEVGSAWYVGFMRIKPKNVPLLTDFVILPYVVGYGNYDSDDDDNSPVIGNSVMLTTGSYEYDRYNKSLYEQKNNIVYDEGIYAFTYQPVNVYSNIRNGLGIFAGYNRVFIDVEKREN